jgi:hypothetical protein
VEAPSLPACRLEAQTTSPKIRLSWRSRGSSFLIIFATRFGRLRSGLSTVSNGGSGSGVRRARVFQRLLGVEQTTVWSRWSWSSRTASIPK